MRTQSRSLPIPRLYNVPIGASIRLEGDNKTRVVVHKCAQYAYFDLFKASLGHPVAADCMVFGDGGGWRPR